MGLFIEGQWVSPYERFSPEHLKENFDRQRRIEGLVGAKASEIFERTNVSSLVEDDGVIDYDFPYIAWDSVFLTSSGSERILYPIREPNSDELYTQEIDHPSGSSTKTRAIRGFGALYVLLFLDVATIAKLNGEPVYPFSLDLRVGNTTLRGFPKVGKSGSDTGALYDEWTSGLLKDATRIMMPLDLQSLMKLEFRLTRI